MDDPLKNKMPYEHFKIKPGGLKKMRQEHNPVIPAACYYLLKNLNRKHSVAFLGGQKPYYATQKSTVKVSYVSNHYKGQWRAHGQYLGRSGAQRADEKGLGFNETEEDITIAKTLNSWQKEGDPRIWKIIISPERAADLDLREHTRELMEKVEKDLGTKLQWVAIEHYNTLHFHVHLVIRGIRDDGQELRINKDYLKRGLRDRSQRILTQKLGIRTQLDAFESRKKIIKARHITEIDRMINNKLTKDNFINLDWCTKNGDLYRRNLQIRQRLEHLESLGIAKKFTDASWHLDPTFLDYLKFLQEQDDIIKSQRKHSDQIIDKDLPVVLNKLPKLGDAIVGRVIGTGLSERDEEMRYIFVEGVDGQIHYVKANNKIIQLRDNHQLYVGDIIYMERSQFTKDNKEISYLKVDAFPDFESLRTAINITNVDRYIINHVIKNGFVPGLNPTDNAVRIEFMKIVHSRVNFLIRHQILNDDLSLNKNTLDREISLKRRVG